MSLYKELHDQMEIIKKAIPCYHRMSFTGGRVTYRTDVDDFEICFSHNNNNYDFYLDSAAMLDMYKTLKEFFEEKNNEKPDDRD